MAHKKILIRGIFYVVSWCSDAAKKEAGKAEKIVYLAWAYRQVAGRSVKCLTRSDKRNHDLRYSSIVVDYLCK